MFFKSYIADLVLLNSNFINFLVKNTIIEIAITYFLKKSLNFNMKISC